MQVHGRFNQSNHQLYNYTMARYNKGISGSFSGKVGTVIGNFYKKKPYMQSLPQPSTKPPTYPQLVQRARFAKMMAFNQAFQGLYAITLASLAVDMTAYNAAMSINTIHAIKGSYPDFSVDYPKVTLSKGLLLPAADARVEAAGPGAIRFSWTDNSSALKTALASDKAILIAYSETSDLGIYNLKVARRKDGTGLLEQPSFSGMEVETWLAFIAENESMVADSVYVGKVRVG